MTEELKKKLGEFLDKLLVEGEKGFSMVKDKFPTVVEDFLTWSFWDAAVAASLWGIPALVLFVMGVLCIYWAFKEEDNDLLCGTIVAWFVCGLVMIPVMGNLRTAMEVKMSPTTYIIKELRE